jgi:CspA family cold shock protein
MKNKMARGKIKWYNDSKGYGFIAMENGDDIFVHRSELNQIRNIQENQEVTFEIKQGEKGLMAVDVKLVS